MPNIKVNTKSNDLQGKLGWCFVQMQYQWDYIEKYKILQYENISNSLWFITIYPTNEWIWIMMFISGSIINGWKTCNDDSCWRSIRATTAGLFYITFLSMQCGNTAKMILDLTSTMYKHLCRHRYRKPHLLFWVRMSPWYRQLMVAYTSFYSSCSKWYDDDLSYKFLYMTYNICRHGLHTYHNQIRCLAFRHTLEEESLRKYYISWISWL